MYIVYMMYIVYAMYAVYRSLPPVVGGWTGEPTPYPPIPLGGGGGRDHGSRDHIYILLRNYLGQLMHMKKQQKRAW